VKRRFCSAGGGKRKGTRYRNRGKKYLSWELTQRQLPYGGGIGEKASDLRSGPARKAVRNYSPSVSEKSGRGTKRPKGGEHQRRIRTEHREERGGRGGGWSPFANAAGEKLASRVFSHKGGDNQRDRGVRSKTGKSTHHVDHRDALTRKGGEKRRINGLQLGINGGREISARKTEHLASLVARVRETSIAAGRQKEYAGKNAL